MVTVECIVVMDVVAAIDTINFLSPRQPIARKEKTHSSFSFFSENMPLFSLVFKTLVTLNHGQTINRELRSDLLVESNYYGIKFNPDFLLNYLHGKTITFSVCGKYILCDDQQLIRSLNMFIAVMNEAEEITFSFDEITKDVKEIRALEVAIDHGQFPLQFNKL